MIRRTFCFVPGISKNTENKIKIVCPDWDSFLETEISVIPKAKIDLIKSHIGEAKSALEDKNHKFFSERMKHQEHFMLYDYFKDSCCFVDIETTGLSKVNNRVTTVAVFDGEDTRVFIAGQTLSEEALAEHLSKFKMIVTFNGASFDLPFLKYKFPGLFFDQLHVDLRYVCKKLDLTGGLKNIEKEVGLCREGDLADMSGSQAVRLWYKYERKGDEKALELLVRYNIEDVVKLKDLTEIVIPKVKYLVESNQL